MVLLPKLENHTPENPLSPTNRDHRPNPDYPNDTTDSPAAISTRPWLLAQDRGARIRRGRGKSAARALFRGT